MTSQREQHGVSLPVIGFTMGDAAGIGPEIAVRAACDAEVRKFCRPVLFGHPTVIQRAEQLIGTERAVRVAADCCDAGESADDIPVIAVGPDAVAEVEPGTLNPHAGRAAHDAVVAAAEAAIRGQLDAIVTAPLNKESLRLAGIAQPGHTEILAKVCGVDRYAMMLFLPAGGPIRSPHGLCVAHVTLHTSIASVPGLLTSQSVCEKIDLVHEFLRDIRCAEPRIAVCALNPHAGEHGLFGNEEQTIIEPAIAAAKKEGCNVTGPLPADTLFRRAVSGEFDGVVAMYHDQGHIAFKLIGFDRAVNVTLGLPIVRTSPSQGTAFDIAWTGRANPDGFIEAVRMATLLAANRREPVSAT